MRYPKFTNRNIVANVVTVLCLLFVFLYIKKEFLFRFKTESVTRSKQPRYFFPALENFKLSNSIDGDFGQYQISRQYWLGLNVSKFNIPQQFMPALTSKEKLISLYVLQSFINACHDKNITFFIEFGTLLGSIRHHGFIPWDDDMDVYVDQKDRWKLITLDLFEDGFYINTAKYHQWKFYNSRLPKLFNYPYNWPYVDIFFFEVLDNAVYDVTHKTEKRIHHYNDVFPLRDRPFEGAFLPSPRNYFKSEIYSDVRRDVCTSTKYIHKMEKRHEKEDTVSIKCSFLYPIYPFVFRSVVSHSTLFQVEEQLKIGEKLLYTLIIEAN